MTKETDHLQRKLPKAGLKLGSLIIAGAAIYSGCKGNNESNVATDNTPTQVRTELLIKTPTPTQELQTKFEPTETPKINTLPSIEDQIIAQFGKLVVSDLVSNEVWTMNVDGTGKTLLTDKADPIPKALCSPTGDKIAVAEYDATITGSKSLYWSIYRNSGELIKRIDQAGDLSWSPDGNSVLYSKFFNGIFELDLSSGQSRPIVNTRGYTLDHSPSLSPDGTKLIYVHHEFGGSYYVSLVPVSSLPIAGEDRNGGVFNQQVNILDHGGSSFNQDFRFFWTPDSKKVVYFVNWDKGAIKVVDTPNHSIIEFNHDNLGVANIFWLDGIALSHDGKKIVFEEFDLETRSEGIYLVDINTRMVQKVFDNVIEGGSRWSDNDQYVILGRNFENGRIINTNNLAMREIPNTKFLGVLDWCRKTG